MNRRFRVLIEVGEGALGEMGWEPFTSREFGTVLQKSMQFIPEKNRYLRPLNGAVAGQVLGHLSKKGLVVRVDTPRSGWQPL